MRTASRTVHEGGTLMAGFGESTRILCARSTLPARTSLDPEFDERLPTLLAPIDAFDIVVAAIRTDHFFFCGLAASHVFIVTTQLACTSRLQQLLHDPCIAVVVPVRRDRRGRAWRRLPRPATSHLRRTSAVARRGKLPSGSGNSGYRIYGPARMPMKVRRASRRGTTGHPRGCRRPTSTISAGSSR